MEFAKALADETRQKIMALCCCEWISVNDIVDKLDVAQPTVSHHLKILKNAGLVKSERKGKQVMYTIDQQHLAKGGIYHRGKPGGPAKAPTGTPGSQSFCFYDNIFR